MKLSVTVCSVVGDVKTAYYPNPYLVPTNAEMSLLSDRCVIVTAFPVAFARFVHTAAMFCFLLCRAS
jgi:hypothetical protein